MGRSFAVFYFKEDHFIAVDAVNAPRDFMFGKMSLTRGVNIDKARLADTETALKDTTI